MEYVAGWVARAVEKGRAGKESRGSWVWGQVTRRRGHAKGCQGSEHASPAGVSGEQQASSRDRKGKGPKRGGPVLLEEGTEAVRKE